MKNVGGSLLHVLAAKEGWRDAMEIPQIPCVFDVRETILLLSLFNVSSIAIFVGTGLYESVSGDIRKLAVEGHRCSWCRTVHGQVLYRIASTNSESDGRDL